MSTYEQVTGRLPPKSLLKQRYLIDSVAGRGGMSAVYKGIDTVNGNRLVAIKEMSQNPVLMSQINEATARFYQEADLLRSLHHPNLPRIYDAFSENGRSYLVMDYIEGKTLLQLLHDAHQPLPVPQVIDYALQLCDVLNYLHQHQPPIIFRDLKPTNVMVQRDGHIYLIDFGIARFFKKGRRRIPFSSARRDTPRQNNTEPLRPIPAQTSTRLARLYTAAYRVAIHFMP